MTYYLIILFFLIVCTVVEANSKRGTFRTKQVVFVAFLLLVLLRTFARVESLPDLTFYNDIFEESRYFDVKTSFLVLSSRVAEPGYLLLTKLCGYLSSDFHFELMVIGLIVVASYFKTIDKCSRLFWLSVLLFFLLIYPSSTYILRQYLAMSILFVSIPYILEKKLIPFLIITAVAISVHQSAIVWLPIYFIYTIKSNTSLVVVMLLLAGVLLFTNNIFGRVINTLGSDFERYADYASHKVMSSYFVAIPNTLYLMLYIGISKQRIFKEGINKFLLICAALTVALSWIAINGEGLMFRLIVYFSQMNILLLPLIISELKDKNMKLLLGTLFVLINLVPNYFVERSFHAHQLYNSGWELVFTTIVLSFSVFFLFSPKNLKNGKKLINKNK